MCGRGRPPQQLRSWRGSTLAAVERRALADLDGEAACIIDDVQHGCVPRRSQAGHVLIDRSASALPMPVVVDDQDPFVAEMGIQDVQLYVGAVVEVGVEAQQKMVSAEVPIRSTSSAPGSVIPWKVSKSITRRSMAPKRRRAAIAIMHEPPRHTPHSMISPRMSFSTRYRTDRNRARPRANEVIVQGRHSFHIAENSASSSGSTSRSALRTLPATRERR